MNDLIQIKKTKRVEMCGDRDGVALMIGSMNVWIPVKIVFQVKRGLESYTQRFYRKNKKAVK